MSCRLRDADKPASVRLTDFAQTDVRFKDHGLQAIEVQDNGDGIPPDSYEVIGEPQFQRMGCVYA